MGNNIAEGRQLLVVEDEFAIILIIEDALRSLGAKIVGPLPSLDEALLVAEKAMIDAAILDINIDGGNSYAVADVLVRRGIPFVFCTGYSDWAIEERHRDQPRLAKPYSAKELSTVVRQLLGALK